MTQTTSARPRTRLEFLDVLRVLAMVLVVWAHLVGQFLERRDRSWLPLQQIQRYVAEPAAIINYLGWIGVALFFLISGFAVSLAAASETSTQYAVKRFARIYPALTVAVFVAWGIEHLRARFDIVDSGPRIVPVPSGILEAVWNSTLANYVMVPQPIVLYVAWSLMVQVIFYVMVFIVRPLLRYGGAASWAILAAVAIALQTARDYGDHYFLLVVSISYIPILVAGQALWLRWSGRIATPQLLLITGAAWVLWNRGLESLQPAFLAPTYSYGASLALAYAAFLVALLRTASLAPNRIVRYLSSRSYSVYLLHGPLGLVVLDLTADHMPFTVALTVALAAVMGASELSFRLVEQPSQRAARRILSRTGPHVAVPEPV